MANDLTSLNASVPAHIAAAFGGNLPSNADLAAGVSAGYPIVSYKGKSWHVVENGERILVTRGGDGADADEPAASIAAVIIRANPNLNKVYYPDGYEEGSTEKPLCHSNDALAPALDAQQPQAKKCAVCPHNQWGSKVTENGARGKACSDSRRLAIAPEGELDRVMLLRVPAASLKTLLAYGQNLDKRGVPYQALVTQIGFDHSVAYPSLTFKPKRWLDADEVNEVKELMDSDLVLTITAMNMPSVADADTPEDGDAFQLPPGGPPGVAAPAAATAAKPAKPAARKTATRAATEGEIAAALGATPAEPIPDEPVAAPAAQPAPAAARKTTGFGGGAKKTAAPAAAPATAEAVETGASQATVLAQGALADLDEVLSAFDDA